MVLGGVVALADALPVLHTKTDNYKNVTLISRTPTHVFVQHSRGVATLKLADLSADEVKGLGITITNLASGAPNGTAGSGAGPSNPGAVSGWAKDFKLRLGEAAGQVGLGMGARLALGILVVAFLFFSYTSMLICRKAGMEPGALVWVPVFQLIPLLRAAGMSGWWLLGLFVPVLGLVLQIIWCFKISAARGKGVVTAICLVLPLTGFFAWVYLAFSEAGAATEAEPKPPAKPVQTEPIPA